MTPSRWPWRSSTPGPATSRHEVRVEDLTGFEPETSPWVDESAHLLGRKVVLTTETHAFVIDPDTGDVLRAMPFGPHTPYSWRLPDGRIASQTLRARPQTRAPRSSNRDTNGPVGVDRRASTTPAPDSSPPRGRPTGRRRPTSRSVTPSGDRSGTVDARRRLCGRGGLPPRRARGRRSRARRSWRSTTPGRWRSREPWRDTAARCSASSWPDRRSGLLWTAGRDGTAVAFDLTGHARRAADGGPGRGRQRRQRCGEPGGAHAAVRDRAATPRASSTSTRGATSSASSSRSPTACARSGTPPSPPTGGSPWAGCSSGPTTSRRRSPTEAVSSSGTPTPANRRAPSTRPGSPTGWPSRPTGSGCSSTVPEGGLSTTSPRARRSGATRPTCRAAGSTACRCRAPPPTGPGWSCSGARP